LPGEIYCLLQLSLDASLNGDGTANGRRLKWTGNSNSCTERTCIPYNIYQGATGTKIWGTGNDIYKIQATEYDNGDGLPMSFRIEVPQYLHTLEIGDYTDTLALTIELQ